MITLSQIQDLANKLDAKCQAFEELENQYITNILKLFGATEEKIEGQESISELLQKDRILIVLPPSIYNKIDFSQFPMPRKLVVQSSIYVNQSGLIFGENDINFAPSCLSSTDETRQRMFNKYSFPPQFKSH